MARAAIAPAALAGLAALAPRQWASDFYLAGGTGLAAHLGHRRARELDLMSATNRLTPTDRRDLLSDLLDLDPATRVETARDGYLFVHFGGDLPLRMFWYPYPLVAPTDEVEGFAVASLLDLALMKLGAVISRGTRRDFVDLYCAAGVLPLAETLERAGEKFGHVGDFPLQALKALADLTEADAEPMPAEMLTAVEWPEVRRWALEAAARGGRAVLDGGGATQP